MKIRIMIMVIMVSVIGVVASARADVLLVLNDKTYQAPWAIEYNFATSVVEVEFEEGLLCSGEAAAQPGDGLTIRLDDQYYALGGEIVLNFSSDPAELVMTSDGGALVCTLDRIFRNRFVI